MSGKARWGACGHLERAIIGQFFLCTIKSCDGRPRCPKCLSKQVSPFLAESLPAGSWHCWKCGACWQPPAP